LLGVCLGIQLLFEASEEGNTPTLGSFPARLPCFLTRPASTVPHIGLEHAPTTGREVGLLDGIEPDARFYFVHSFAAPVNAFTQASCRHGTPFAAIVQRANFSGCQFPPRAFRRGRRPPCSRTLWRVRV